VILMRFRPLGAFCLTVVTIASCLPATAATLFSAASRDVAQALPAPAPLPAGTPCNGISNSSGSPSLGSFAGSSGILVQRFVPPGSPFLPTSVCIAGYADQVAGVGAAGYDVVIFSDRNGLPGTLLATIPAVPAAPGAFPGSWMTTSVSGLVPLLNGPFWAGPRITTDVHFGLDFDAAVAPAIQMILPPDATDGSAGYAFTGGLAEIQVVGLSGADAAIPALSGLGLAALAAALATGGLLAIRRA
jgi:hypothetical protein